ncbi:MAG: hypothetical protein N2247_09520 [Leptospiraceae bacterium]|jgi:hypothetical protein|nr:hypothetical protein [Leptospiraceae bacterium]
MGRIKTKIGMILISLLFLNQQYYENYLDVINLKEIPASKKELWEYKLLFSRVEDVYLVFYDKQRKEIYVQFKEDRFDDRNDKIKNQFISGQPYRIKIKWKGIIKKNQFLPKENFISEKEDLFSLIFIFEYLESYPLVMNELSL